MAKSKKKREWNLSVYVPETGAVAGDDILSRATFLRGRDVLQDQAGGVKSIPSKDFEDQWSDTVQGLLSNMNDWAEHAMGEWQIDEITVGLTVSGEGQLIFIAKAGAQGSITLKLTRKGAPKAA